MGHCDITLLCSKAVCLQGFDGSVSEVEVSTEMIEILSLPPKLTNFILLKGEFFAGYNGIGLN